MLRLLEEGILDCMIKEYGFARPATAARDVMTLILLSALIAVLTAATIACMSGSENAGNASVLSSGMGVAGISPTGSAGVNFNFDQTELVSVGERFEIPLVCIHRILRPCALLSGEITGAPGFVARVEERTDGQVQFQVTSFPELDIVGTNTMRLIEDGTLSMGEIYSGHIGDDFPEMDISNLWGLYPTADAQFDIIDAIQPEMMQATADNGGVQIFYTYTADNFLFSRTPIRDEDDFKGLKVRSHSPLLDDLLTGIGAEPHSTAFIDTYAALEEGTLDAAISCGSCGYDVRWFEVADYLAGPIVSITHGWFAMNQAHWDEIPADLQNIILEEGARHSAINRKMLREQWQQQAIQINLSEGMELNRFDETLLRAIQDASIERVVPSWLERVGGHDSPMAAIFNEKLTPIIGVEIHRDGITRVDAATPHSDGNQNP